MNKIKLMCQIQPQKKDIHYVLTYCTTCVRNSTEQRQQLRLTKLHEQHKKNIVFQIIPQKKAKHL
jgi:hypothetical protein